MTEYQLSEAVRAARRVRQHRLAFCIAVWAAAMLALVGCGTDTQVHAGVSGESVVERSQVLPVAVVDPTGHMLALPATTTTTVAPRNPRNVARNRPAEPLQGSTATGTTQANRALGKRMAAEYGWTGEQWTCLDLLWQHESGWKHTATNPSSGAYGIPQSLPGSKMASHGADWRTNPATQISWGLSYIGGRYSTPCGALTHSRTKGWY